jgi:hypothetical protein
MCRKPLFYLPLALAIAGLLGCPETSLLNGPSVPYARSGASSGAPDEARLEQVTARANDAAATSAVPVPATLAPVSLTQPLGLAPVPTTPTLFPSMSPRAAPVPPPSQRIGQFNATHQLIPFVSNRGQSGGGGLDIYLYDRTIQTVLTPPGVNTPGDEANPNLSNNNLWLVYSSTAQGRTEIHLFDMVTQLVDNLPVLNASSDSNVSPSVNNDGDLIAYTSRELGIDRLHIYNVRTDTNYVPAPVARLGTTINNPFISGDGTLVAFSSPVLDHQLDIFIYSVVHGTVLAAPFVNTESSEDEPAFSPDNQRMAFSTNRNGNEDVMLVDFRTGFVDRLPLANSHADEVTPSFIGTAGDQLLYLSDRGGKSNRQMLVYEFKNDLVDTIPVSHVIGKLDKFSPP